MSLPVKHDGWWQTREGRKMCRDCGEERLVEPITDARGTQHTCKVCGHAWWVEETGCAVS
jgi:hypothetical protein